MLRLKVGIQTKNAGKFAWRKKKKEKKRQCIPTHLPPMNASVCWFELFVRKVMKGFKNSPGMRTVTQYAVELQRDSQHLSC